LQRRCIFFKNHQNADKLIVKSNVGPEMTFQFHWSSEKGKQPDPLIGLQTSRDDSFIPRNGNHRLVLS